MSLSNVARASRRAFLAAVALSALAAFPATAQMLVEGQHYTRIKNPQPVGSAAQPVPTIPGQDAFGAIQGIVRILEADPNTDWAKINLAAGWGTQQRLRSMTPLELCLLVLVPERREF